MYLSKLLLIKISIFSNKLNVCLSSNIHEKYLFLIFTYFFFTIKFVHDLINFGTALSKVYTNFPIFSSLLNLISREIPQIKRILQRLIHSSAAIFIIHFSRVNRKFTFIFMRQKSLPHNFSRSHLHDSSEQFSTTCVRQFTPFIPFQLKKLSAFSIECTHGVLSRSLQPEKCQLFFNIFARNVRIFKIHSGPVGFFSVIHISLHIAQQNVVNARGSPLTHFFSIYNFFFDENQIPGRVRII